MINLASKISVYSDSQKKMLIKTKIANNKQIVINGCQDLISHLI